MFPVDTIPLEIVAIILQECSNFQDVLALTSTCKILHFIWKSEISKGVIWRVGCRSIFAFDVALPAARATNLVQEAHERATIAPIMTISSLTGIVRKPHLDELKKVVDMQNLVRCIKHIFLLPKNSRICFRSETMDDNPIDYRNWDANFDLAVYRVLVAGAFVAHAYQAPFFDTSGNLDDDFLRKFYAERDEARQLNEDGSLYDMDYFTKEEVAHIRNFPVYEFEVFENMEAAFGPFWDWFLDDCEAKRRLPVEGENDDSFQQAGCIPTKDKWLITEIARLLCIHKQLCNYHLNTFFANGDQLFGHCRAFEDLSTRLIAKKTHPIPVVIFGNFCLEEILIPDSTKDVGFDLLVVNQVSSTKRLPDISILFKYCDAYSGLPNHRDDEEDSPFNISPCLPLQFFEFVLRKKFHVRFENNGFRLAVPQGGRIFYDGHHDPMPFLQPEHPLPFLSYEPDW